jgi:hypothetical protein
MRILDSDVGFDCNLFERSQNHGEMLNATKELYAIAQNETQFSDGIHEMAQRRWCRTRAALNIASSITRLLREACGASRSHGQNSCWNVGQWGHSAL